MKKYKISSHLGIKDPACGFLWSLDFISKNRLYAGIIMGLFKYLQFYLSSKQVSLGFFYINIKSLPKIKIF